MSRIGRIGRIGRKLLQRRLCVLCGVMSIVAAITLGLLSLYFYGRTFVSSSQLSHKYSFENNKVNKLALQNRVETASKQYAVFACSITSNVIAYCFYTPIITIAWRRLGYQVIVIFVGDFVALNGTKPADVRLAAKWVTHFGGITYDFQCEEAYAIKISQIIRLFIGFLPFSFIDDNDFLLTTDSDLMPLRREQYMIRKNYPDGFVLNRWCCGTFRQRNKTYLMFPMGYIHIKRKVWRTMILESTVHRELADVYAKHDQEASHLNETTLKHNNLKKQRTSMLLHEAPLSFESISLYLRHRFGTLYDQKMTKGDAAWDMDQKLVTMFLGIIYKGCP